MNIDWLKPSSNKTKLNAFLKSLNLLQLIEHPTHITETTLTLIDHIYCNNTVQYNHASRVEPGLSDHVLVFTNRKK